MKHRVLTVTEFKAKCLALLTEVADNGITITVTKRGRPLATVGPTKKSAWKNPEGIWRGKLGMSDDEIDEILMRDTSQDWDCVHEAEAARHRR